jgi:hypothetical protein
LVVITTNKAYEAPESILRSFYFYLAYGDLPWVEVFVMWSGKLALI